VEEWRGDPRGAITVRQLMQMRSGLKVHPIGLADPNGYALIFGRNITKTVLETPLVEPPGQTFEYANVNCFIAGLALDRALTRAGEGRYVEFLSRELWRPLGQSDAMIDVDGPNGIPRFFAGLSAPARDWMRLGLLFIQDGRVNDRQVVPSEWLKTMVTPSANPSYGLFIWIGNPWIPLRSYGPDVKAKVACKEPFLASDMVYFDGAGGQRVYASARLKLVIVRTGAQSPAWDDSALPNAIIRGFA
jgi:CubicO group peptidase (beta-lactamase class C family)